MLNTLSFGAEAPYCLDSTPTRQEMTAHAPFWAVGTDDWGNLITWDPCESRTEAEEFVCNELHGRGVVMTEQELLNALDMGEEICA